MKIVILTIFILLFISSLFAQLGTDVSGIISGETWTSTGNPYRVNGDVDVHSLVIGAGVEILVIGNYRFRISGSLAAAGTQADSIIFSGSGTWQGVHFDTSSANSSMSYCRISGATYGLRSTESVISISNSQITSNNGNGIEVQNGSVRLERCLIDNNGLHGLLASSGGKAFIFNSIIRANTQNGLRTETGVLQMSNSIVTSNAQGGIFLANTVDSLLFENCTLVDNTGGPGIVLFGGTVSGINSIIYSNALSVGFASGSVSIDYSDIEDLASYTGSGSDNFDLSPGFWETQTYTLGGGSPCIDAGDPDSRYNDVCFPPSLDDPRNDMGAYGGPGACLWFDPLVITPASLSFGNVSIGDTMTSSILFRNYRDTTITVNSLLISGTDAGLFFTESGGYVLSAFDSLRRDIRFSPLNTGNFSANLIVNSSEGQNFISLTGRGVAPDIQVVPSDSLIYGSIRALESASADIVITNVGIGNLRINDLSPDSDHFTVNSPPLPFIIDPFTSDTISVEFRPDSSGIFSATLQIISNDPDENPTTVALTGNGIAPKISLQADTLDLGRVNVFSDTLVQFQVSNTGTDTLVVFSGGVIDPENLFSMTAGQFPFSIPPGGLSRNLDIQFQPVAVGNFTALLHISSNDPKRDSLDVPLSGTGIAPRIETTPDSLGFGEVVVNNVKMDSVVIRNTGNANLLFSWDNLENPGSIFTLLNPPSSLLLAPGQSYSIRISFTPQDTGTVFTVLPVSSNDADRDSLRIKIIGTGIQPILAIAADSLDFGTVLIQENSDRSFDIANTGTGGLIIDTAFTAAGDTSAFSVLSDFPLIIPAFGSAVPLTVRFQPPARGLYEDTLYVSSNDPDNVLVPLKLRGRGSAPTIEIIQTSMLFSTTYVTETSSDSLLIKNSGEGDLYLTNTEFIKSASSSFTLDTAVDSLVVPGKDSVYIYIQFEPTAGGVFNDSLIIFNSDPSNYRLAIYLEGNSIYDITPAQIQEYASFDTLQTGRSFVFEALIQDNETIIQRVFLDIRNAGEANFQRLTLSHGFNNIWSVLLPQERINIRGIEYYVQVFHGGTITNFGTQDQPKKKAVHITDYQLPGQTFANRYQMISLPVNTQNQSLSVLFSDDLGAYDNTAYRFFDWDSEDSAFVELSSMSSTLNPGKALWLITRNSKNLDLDNSLSVLADSSYTISLESGWNMFGNPFAFDVAWNAIVDTMIQGGTAYYYDGSEWIFPVERMEPFKGYAVYVHNQTSLHVPQREAPPLTKSDVTVDEWHIRIEARSGSFRDTYNFAGVRSGSKNGHDIFDVFNPPSPSKELSVYLDQGLAADYRTPGQDNYQYEFTLVSLHNQNDVRILPQNLPQTLQCAVVSPQTHIKYADNTFSVGAGVHSFILYVGNHSFLEKQLERYNDVPQTYLLSQNFPNPFNPITTIRFQLPRATEVNIEVYNLLGQHIASLVKSKFLEQGYHEVQWDGRDDSGKLSASGLYFLHFYSPEYNKTIKMILHK